jgi:hypothetical protein
MTTASGDKLGKQKHGVRHLARQAGARRQATRLANWSMAAGDTLDGEKEHGGRRRSGW